MRDTVSKAGSFCGRSGTASGRHVQLEERHIVTYQPMIVDWSRPAMGSEVQPMCPGYLFVHTALPDDFYRVSRGPGVKGFVGFGGAPAEVADAVVDFLRRQEGPDGLIGCHEYRVTLIDENVEPIVNQKLGRIDTVSHARVNARRLRLHDILAEETDKSNGRPGSRRARRRVARDRGKTRTGRFMVLRQMMRPS